MDKKARKLIARFRELADCHETQASVHKRFSEYQSRHKAIAGTFSLCADLIQDEFTPNYGEKRKQEGQHEKVQYLKDI